MLQFNQQQTATEVQIAQREAPSPAEAMTSIIQFVYRQLPVILLTTCLTAALGLLYLLITPPSYTALATMLIDSKRGQIFQQTPNGDLANEAAIVASQVEIFRSEKIALAVVNKLELWKDAEFIGPPRGLMAILNNAMSDVEVPQTQEARVRRALDVFQDRLVAKRVGATNVIELTFRSYNPERAIQVANSIASAYIADQLE